MAKANNKTRHNYILLLLLIPPWHSELMDYMYLSRLLNLPSPVIPCWKDTETYRALGNMDAVIFAS